jgi:hypothetical protein
MRLALAVLFVLVHAGLFLASENDQPITIYMNFVNKLPKTTLTLDSLQVLNGQLLTKPNSTLAPNTVTRFQATTVTHDGWARGNLTWSMSDSADHVWMVWDYNVTTLPPVFPISMPYPLTSEWETWGIPLMNHACWVLCPQSAGDDCGSLKCYFGDDD